MKTYLFSLIDKYKQYSQKMDVQAVLCSKAWYVLNEDGNSEILIFKTDYTGYASVCGDTSVFKWEFLPQNNSLLINYDDLKGIMLRPSYFENGLLVCRKDGTQDCMFLIDDCIPDAHKMKSLEEVKLSLAAIGERHVRQEQLQLQETLRAEEEARKQVEDKARKKAEEAARQKTLKDAYINRLAQDAEFRYEERKKAWEQFIEQETLRVLNTDDMRAKKRDYHIQNQITMWVLSVGCFVCFVYAFFDSKSVDIIDKLVETALYGGCYCVIPAGVCAIFGPGDDNRPPDIIASEEIREKFSFEKSYLDKEGNLRFTS